MTEGQPLNTPPAAVMMTVGEIADRDGVSRAAVSQAVKKLIEHGLTVERDDRGRVSGVNAAEYDALRERVGDPSKDQRPEPTTLATPAADSYDEALRVKTWYEAERRRLELDQQRGALIPAAEIEAAVDAAIEAIAGCVRKLQNEAESLATTVGRDGVHGLRLALKSVETKMLAEIATALEAIAEGRATSE